MNRKKRQNQIIWATLIIVLIIITFICFLKSCSAQIIGKAIEINTATAQCKESDNGNDPNNAGVIAWRTKSTRSGSTGWTKWIQSADLWDNRQGKLREYYCGTDGLPKTQYLSCPSGYDQLSMNFLEKVNGKTIPVDAYYCKLNPVCGNGILEANEECDDGNSFYGDGCSPICSIDKACNPGAVCPQLLLNNPKIISGIKANPLVNNTDNFQKILLIKINDLETNNFEYWTNYRKINLSSYHPGTISNPDPELIKIYLELYLQKAALMLYVEAHQLVPWSILDYSDEDLTLLLSDSYVDDCGVLPIGPYCGNYQALSIPYFNGDPHYGFDYIDESKKLYPDKEIKNQKDLLDLVIFRMREDGWTHYWHNGTEEMYQKYMEGAVLSNPVELPVMLYSTGGGDATMSLALYALLQSQNIPSKEIPSYLNGSHTGLYFPTLGLSMKGNNVFNTWKSGYIHGYDGTEPNLLPINLTYDKYDTEYLVWMQEPTYCGRAYHLKRDTALDYLSQYNHATGKYDVLYAYCYYSIQHATTNTLLDILTKPSADCQNTDPAQENYQKEILTPEEITSWDATLNASVICKEDWDYEVLT